MIYTVTFSPTLDYIVRVDNFRTGIINRTVSETVFPGGKGINVSMTLKNLGHQSCALGFTAGFTGAEIRRLLRQNGVECNFISVENGMSRINMKIISGEETAINGQGAHITTEDIGILFARLRCLADDDYLVLAGHIPPSLPSNIYEQVLEMLNIRQLNVVVDAEMKALTDTLKYKPFLIKPNAEELGDIFNVRISTRQEALIYAGRLREMGARNVLVSLGPGGAVLLAEDGSVISSGAIRGRVVSTVGAGDAMVAGFLAGYIESGGDYLRAFRMALCAGSASAFSVGLPEKVDVNHLMSRNDYTIEISGKVR